MIRTSHHTRMVVSKVPRPYASKLTYKISQNLTRFTISITLLAVVRLRTRLSI